MWSANMNNLTIFSNLCTLCPFSSLFALIKASNIIWIRVLRVGIVVFFRSKGKCSQLFPIQYAIGHSFVMFSLFHFEACYLYNLWRAFDERVFNLINCCFYMHEEHGFCSFIVCMIPDMYWYVRAELSLIFLS